MARDYDRELLSSEDYAKVQQAKQDYANATTQQAKDQAHQTADQIRRSYGYTLGANGATYAPYLDYDKNLLSMQDYNLLQQAKQDYASAATQAEKDSAHQEAEKIRAAYGYSMGTNGATYTPLNARPGVSAPTQYNLSSAQNAAQNTEFQSAWEAQVQGLADQILNREKFSYDLNEDALYDQYRQMYTRLGQQAMTDTMGQAAGLTGGYGSTYAQGAAQQAYNTYLQQLNDVVPELYSQARDAYDAQTNDLYNRFGMANSMYATDYDRYRDTVTDAQNMLDYWQNQAGVENSDYWAQKNYDQQEQATAYERQKQEEATAYERKQNEYARLVTLISTTGYTPTSAELSAAGMTQEEANAWKNYYTAQKAASNSGGGGGGGSRSGRSGSSGGSRSGRSGSSGGNEGNDQVTQIASEIHARSATVEIDSRTLDNWLDGYGLSREQRAAVKNELAAMGHGTSGRR